MRWDSSVCLVGLVAAVAAVSRAGNWRKSPQIAAYLSETRSPSGYIHVDLRCFRTPCGASTTSSPGKAGLTRLTPRSSIPVSFACTLFVGRKSSRKSAGGVTFCGPFVILTCRMLRCPRIAIRSTVTVPATISSSQRRPRAIDATSVARVSARIGRASWGGCRLGHDDLAPPF